MYAKEGLGLKGRAVLILEYRTVLVIRRDKDRRRPPPWWFAGYSIIVFFPTELKTESKLLLGGVPAKEITHAVWSFKILQRGDHYASKSTHHQQSHRTATGHGQESRETLVPFINEDAQSILIDRDQYARSSRGAASHDGGKKGQGQREYRFGH
jgi:hypothetical protein